MDPIIEIDDFSNETLDDVVHTELSNSEDEILREDVLTLTLSDEESEENTPLQSKQV